MVFSWVHGLKGRGLARCNQRWVRKRDRGRVRGMGGERRGDGRHKLTCPPLPSVDRSTCDWVLIDVQSWEMKGELVVMGD